MVLSNPCSLQPRFFSWLNIALGKRIQSETSSSLGLFEAQKRTLDSDGLQYFGKSLSQLEIAQYLIEPKVVGRDFDCALTFKNVFS